MITEDYVSFEIAKLLKKKGFNEYCWKLYELGDLDKPILLNGFELDSDGKFCNNKYLELYKKEHSYINDICSAPTLQTVMKWLRLIHDVDITIIPLRSVKKYFPRIESDKISYDGSMYTIYEEAAEAGIKYCLENLI